MTRQEVYQIIHKITEHCLRPLLATLHLAFSELKEWRPDLSEKIKVWEPTVNTRNAIDKGLFFGYHFTLYFDQGYQMSIKGRIHSQIIRLLLRRTCVTRRKFKVSWIFLWCSKSVQTVLVCLLWTYIRLLICVLNKEHASTSGNLRWALRLTTLLVMVPIVRWKSS